MLKISKQIPYKGNSWLGLYIIGDKKVKGFNVDGKSPEDVIQKVEKQAKVDEIKIKSGGKWVDYGL